MQKKKRKKEKKSEGLENSEAWNWRSLIVSLNQGSKMGDQVHPAAPSCLAIGQFQNM